MLMNKLLLVFILLFPAVCMNAQWAVDASVRGFVQTDIRQGRSLSSFDAGSVVRFAPAVAHLGLGLVGVKSKHALLDRSIESVVAHGFGVGGGFLLKRLVNRMRPDGSTSDSFPSGHAILAFTGAELLRIDYGWGWGAGGYAIGLAVGADRLYRDRHWLTDVLAGAGIGILSAHLGAWLLEPVKNLFGIPALKWDGLAFAPLADPFTGSYGASVSMVF